MNPMDQSQTPDNPDQAEPSSKIEVSPDMFQDANDGDKVKVEVEGTLKINGDGTACIYPETVDGQPVAQTTEQDPAAEGMAKMKAAGYGQGQGIQVE